MRSTTYTSRGLVHRAEYQLLAPQLSQVLIASTHGGTARLSWPSFHCTLHRML